MGDTVKRTKRCLFCTYTYVQILLGAWAHARSLFFALYYRFYQPKCIAFMKMRDADAPTATGDAARSRLMICGQFLAERISELCIH